MPRLVGLIGLLVILPRTLAAQSAPPLLEHVRWPLLELVVLPDSCIGVWLLVAPSAATTAWAAKSSVVPFELDPILALQWATVARGLTRAATEPAAAGRPTQTPPLRPSRGPRLLILARNPTGSKPGEEFVLAVSDSTSDTHWRTHASAPQVDSLVTAVERTAEHARTILQPRDSSHAATENDPSVDSPADPESIPAPPYPVELLRKRIAGQVWLEFVVGPDGRAEAESFRPLLSDDWRLTRSAVHALSRGRFRPARSRGEPIRQRVFQVVSFRVQ